MNVYKHTAVSFALSALLFITLKKVQMAVACFLTGILIDVDHIFDYYINHELRNKIRYLRHPLRLLGLLWEDRIKPERAYKLIKALHSLELLIPALILYAFGIWNDIATGILIGFVTHLIMDVLSLGHIGPISIIYKVKKRFPRGVDIMKMRLSGIGRDVDKCQVCGIRGDTIAHKHKFWYAGFTKRRLKRVMILCRDCYNRIECGED
jgi:hypothetical protein